MAVTIVCSKERPGSIKSGKNSIEVVPSPPVSLLVALKKPGPSVIDQPTVAPLTGLPCASVSRTCKGSSRNPYWSPTSWPWPDSIVKPVPPGPPPPPTCRSNVAVSVPSIVAVTGIGPTWSPGSITAIAMPSRFVRSIARTTVTPFGTFHTTGALKTGSPLASSARTTSGRNGPLSGAIVWPSLYRIVATGAACDGGAAYIRPLPTYGVAIGDPLSVSVASAARARACPFK